MTRPPPWKPEAVPYKESATSSSAMASAQAEFAKEIREAYPDGKDMPENVRRVVEKHDLLSGRQLSSAMNKATKHLDKTRSEMRNLLDAQSKHKSHWMKHMKSLIETLTKQVEAFDTQQKDYSNKIRIAHRNIQTARNDLQKLTAEAAADRTTDLQESAIEEEEHTEAAVDVEEDSLRSQVHELLAKCLKTADRSIVVEIASDEENAMDTSAERASKRPRSTEPYGSGGK